VAYNLIACDRAQHYLLPPSIDDWLEEDHLARFVIDVVDEMDLSAFYARRREDGWGRAAFDAPHRQNQLDGFARAVARPYLGAPTPGPAT
jgi:hypothetical protein